LLPVLLLAVSVAFTTPPETPAEELPFRWPFLGPLVEESVGDRIGAFDFYQHLPPLRATHAAPLWDYDFRTVPFETRMEALSPGAAPRTRAPYWTTKLSRPRMAPSPMLFWRGPVFAATAANATKDLVIYARILLLGWDVSPRLRWPCLDDDEHDPSDQAQRCAVWLDHHDARVRLHSVQRLRGLCVAGAIDPLLAALADDPSPAVREAAAECLAAFEAHGAMQTLQRSAQEDDDPDVRRAAALAIENLQPHRFLSQFPTRRPDDRPHGLEVLDD